MCMAGGGEKVKGRDFPGSSVVKTSPSKTGCVGSIPGQGTKILQALWSENQNCKTEAIL